MTKTSYNVQIADRIRSIFHELDWKFKFDAEEGLFITGVSIDGPIQDLQMFIHVKDTEFMIYGFSPIHADCKNAKMMAKLAEFITRANYGLKNGNFEMDYDDGEIRYKCYIDCDGVLPSKMVVVDGIHVCSAMFKRYAPGITGIIFADKSAAEAVEECENVHNILAKALSQLDLEDDADDDDSQSNSTSSEATSSCTPSGESPDDIDGMFARLMSRFGIALS